MVLKSKKGICAVKNVSSSSILVKSAKYCSSPFSKFIGLMFSTEKSKSLIFEFRKENRISLHMFFVFYPIDVIFLNRNKKIVDMKIHFKPFTLYTSKKNAVYCIEFPDGTIKETKTRLGDKIEF